MSESPYTTTTRDIAEQLAGRVFGATIPMDYSKMIYVFEKELDKYFDEGTIMWRRDTTIEVELPCKTEDVVVRTIADDLPKMSAITPAMNQSSLYGLGEIGLMRESQEKYTAAMRKKLDDIL